MHFTPEQKATIKAYVLADPVLLPMTSGPTTDYGFIANTLAAYASPVVLAWVNNVSPSVVDDAPDYSTFDSIAAGKRDSWGFFLRSSRDFARNKTRKWITDIWGATLVTPTTLNSDAILLSGTENARVIEVVLGGTTKTTGAVSAMARNYVGSIDLLEIAAIFNVQA